MQRLLDGLCCCLAVIAAQRAIAGRIQLRTEIVMSGSLVEDAAAVPQGEEYGTHH